MRIVFECDSNARIPTPTLVFRHTQQHGGTALFSAAAGGRAECVRFLLDVGSNLHHADQVRCMLCGILCVLFLIRCVFYRSTMQHLSKTAHLPIYFSCQSAWQDCADGGRRDFQHGLRARAVGGRSRYSCR